MLVITRDSDQSFTIGDDITINILKTGERTRYGIRIGIEAPKNMAILRDDIIKHKPSKRKTTINYPSDHIEHDTVLNDEDKNLGNY